MILRWARGSGLRNSFIMHPGWSAAKKVASRIAGVCAFCVGDTREPQSGSWRYRIYRRSHRFQPI